MLGGLFGRAKKTFPTRQDAFAAFLLAQFLPEYRWEIPEAEFNEWIREAGTNFQKPCTMWFLIYCAWLFRGAVIYRHNENFQKEVMTALRVRLAKVDPKDCGQLIDLPRLLEFWFVKLDSAASDFMTKKPTINGHEVPLQYGVAIAFVALDDCSPYHMNPDAPTSSLLNLMLALAKVHDRMQPRMLGIVDMIDKHEPR